MGVVGQKEPVPKLDPPLVVYCILGFNHHFRLSMKEEWGGGGGGGGGGEDMAIVATTSVGE